MSLRCHKQIYLTYWPLRSICTWVHSDAMLTLFWRSGWAPAASILSTTWRWPQNEADIKAETPFCSGYYQLEQVGLQHLYIIECNVVYKEIKQCKIHQILHTLRLRVFLIPVIIFTSELLEGLGRWCSKFKTASNSTFMEQITPMWKEKSRNEWMNEKPQKCTCMSNIFCILSQSERTYWSLIPQLETVIIKVSTVQALRLRPNSRRLHRTKHLNWTYGDTGFKVVKLAILIWRYLHLLEYGKPLLAWVPIKNVNTSVSTQTACQLTVLEPFIKDKVHC